MDNDTMIEKTNAWVGCRCCDCQGIKCMIPHPGHSCGGSHNVVYNPPIEGLADGGIYESVESQHMKGITMGETRIVDPATGGAKSQKIERFDLIPNEFEVALARHYGEGAKKYTRCGKCSCASIARSLEKLILDNGVVPAMKNGFVVITPSSLNASEKTGECGAGTIQIKSCGLTGPITADQQLNVDAWQVAMDLHLKNTIRSFPPLAGFVEIPTNLDTLITIMRQIGSEGLSVTDAISELALLRSVDQSGSTRHWPGCKALVVEHQGDRNWERGYRWSLSVGALRRHLAAWLAGESIDSETGSNHLIAVAWHAIALFIFELRGLGTDDVRVGRKS